MDIRDKSSELERLRYLSSKHPFHNLKRLLRKEAISVPLKGGDCFELANLVTAVFPGGTLVTANYKDSGDFHWLTDWDTCYADLTTRWLLIPKEQDKFIVAPKNDSQIYFTDRKSILDTTLLLRYHTEEGFYLEINGDTLSHAGGYTPDFKYVENDKQSEYIFRKAITKATGLPAAYFEVIKKYLIKVDGVE
jgi:hypothetical protein